MLLLPPSTTQNIFIGVDYAKSGKSCVIVIKIIDGVYNFIDEKRIRDHSHDNKKLKKMVEDLKSFYNVHEHNVFRDIRY